MDIFTKIQNIFYSGNHNFNGDLESINEIAFLVKEKYLNLNTVSISSKSDYFGLLNNQNKLDNMYEAHGGVYAHVALKILAGKFLETQRQQLFVYEHPFCGYYPDILSGNNSIVIECGHTQNPEKMLGYFHVGNIQECIQIPYPSEEDKTILGYSFIAKENLNEFLILLEQEKRSDLKDIFKKRVRLGN